jgi:hypothetical protein
MTATVGLIHQTIPNEHIPALLEHGHYFTPCVRFRDWMEFYYGYCLFNYAMESEKDIRRAIRHATSNPELNSLAASACVSCWVSESSDDSRMWREHGRGGAAIRVSVDADLFCAHVTSFGHHVAHSHVTYEGQISMVRPGRHFVARSSLSASEDTVHHFFFHKRGAFVWEREFRVVIFSQTAITVPLLPKMIEAVSISPLGKLERSIVSALRGRFGDRLRG